MEAYQRLLSNSFGLLYMHLAPWSLIYSVNCFKVGFLKHHPAIQLEGISCCLHSGCRRPLLQTANSRLWIVWCDPRDCVLGLGWGCISFLCSSQYGGVVLFMTKTLVPCQCACYCWAVPVGHQSFLFLSFSSQWVGWEWFRSFKGIQPGKPIWTGPRDNPYHITSCSAVKIVVSVFSRKQPLLRDCMGIRRLWLISFAWFVLVFTFVFI